MVKSFLLGFVEGHHVGLNDPLARMDLLKHLWYWSLGNLLHTTGMDNAGENHRAGLLSVKTASTLFSSNHCWKCR